MRDRTATHSPEKIGMELKSLRLIYFSPTKTTKTVLEAIARGIPVDTTHHMDLTLPNSGPQTDQTIADDLVTIGVPVYGGRVPPIAAKRIRRIRGNGAPAVVVVVYGNRAYDDALLELRDLALEIGFMPVAGGAFVGEHSFASDTIFIANGRPDEGDCNQAEMFGATILHKLAERSDIDQLPKLQVPGNFPYQDHMPPGNVSPVTQDDSCTECETCVSVCPTAAIALNDRVTTSTQLCILCCACVKNCPSGSRVMAEPGVLQIAEWLRENCRDPRQPELFFSSIAGG